MLPQYRLKLRFESIGTRLNVLCGDQIAHSLISPVLVHLARLKISMYENTVSQELGIRTSQFPPFEDIKSRPSISLMRILIRWSHAQGFLGPISFAASRSASNAPRRFHALGSEGLGK